MSITKKGTKRANSKSPKEKYFERHVLPETAIRDFIGSTRIDDLGDVAARFQLIADVTGNVFEEQIDQLDPSDLQLIKRIARQSNNRHYRRIMQSIIAGVAQGPHGINAAHLTARRTVEHAFRWTREYSSALNLYREKLRRVRQGAGRKAQST